MDQLVPFINHGLLPFVGRTAELERLTAFWRLTTESQMCRVALVLGEAGIGKSRVVEQLISEINAAGGATVHAKFRPGYNGSVIPLIARGVWMSPALRSLLKTEPEETLGSVAAALQRVSRLRPTLLVIEDIHLLTGENIPEFTAFFQSMADETVSILCTARPVDLNIRGLIEQYLVEQIRLEGLADSDLHSLCHTLFGFGERDLPELVGAIRDATLGNPLAVRSALRGALTAGTIGTDAAQDRWRIGQTGLALINSLKNTVRVLPEGMAAHLTPGERHAAEQLSCLGEVFSQEAAACMLPDSPHIVDELRFKGIILPSTTATAIICGTPGGNPALAFTHSLVHRFFVENARVNPDALARIIADRLPLYSFDPIALLDEHADGLSPDPDLLWRTIDELDGFFSRLFTSVYHTSRTIVFGCFTHLIEGGTGILPPETRLLTRVRLLNRKIDLARTTFSDDGSAAAGLIAEFLQLTDSPATSGMACHRLMALTQKIYSVFRKDYAACQAIWNEAEDLTEKFPAVMSSREYLGLITAFGLAASSYQDDDLLRLLEKRAVTITALPETPQDVAVNVWRRMGIYLVGVFDTEEELARRVRLLDQIDVSENPLRMYLVHTRIVLMRETGDYAALLDYATRSIPVLREREMFRGVITATISCLCARSALGFDFGGIMNEAADFCRNLSPRLRDRNPQILGYHLFDTVVLGNLRSWEQPVIGMLLNGDSKQVSFAARIIRELRSPDSGLASVRELVGGYRDRTMSGDNRLLYEFAGKLCGQPETRQITGDAQRLLGTPILRTDTVLLVRAVAGLLRIPECAHLAGELGGEIGAAALRSLEWLKERGLWRYMQALLEECGSAVLTQKEGGSWERIIEGIRRERQAQYAAARPKQGEEGPEKIHLSMLGTIQVRHPDGGAPLKISGARQKTLLAMLTADAITGYKLDHLEFCRMVSGGEEDPEYARKYMNNVVKRVRETTGRDAIDTAVKVPRLNLDLVAVDLIDGHGHLSAAISALREGQLPRARAEIIMAMEIFGSTVPFPSLYEEYFETLRNDIDLSMRRTAAKVGRQFVLQDDAGGAEDMLRTAFALYPDDEDIADLLAMVCTALGREFEAGIVRRRAEEFVKPSSRY